MPSCMVLGCLSGTGREQLKYSSSKFPKSPELRNKWLEKINRPDYEFVESGRICHKHFQDDDFVENSENLGSRGKPLKCKRTRLKPNAVPSLYLSNDKMDVLGELQNENGLQMVEYQMDFLFCFV